MLQDDTFIPPRGCPASYFNANCPTQPIFGIIQPSTPAKHFRRVTEPWAWINDAKYFLDRVAGRRLKGNISYAALPFATQQEHRPGWESYSDWDGDERDRIAINNAFFELSDQTSASWNDVQGAQASPTGWIKHYKYEDHRFFVPWVIH
ncbi:hypothetical protein HIM_05698 [Hirsutella minnesotensis 3608]|uniref:Uncharacterized protein n=1 Tax=Hirsutella minnesotensis 3608 TaxID=1043627 RepID=A0A0F8A016_9HYPO|nr:hypothetical protein HIM_05698 [Hirsutella minnesotensis 3608]